MIGKAAHVGLRHCFIDGDIGACVMMLAGRLRGAITRSNRHYRRRLALQRSRAQLI
ncbi:hypothetical protein [Actinokineospora guangxiensis]|uniref:hypothetical protein n=1 Tax=Actinokineospora guangxiensis TaxID=1490288 RepID=UPI00366EB1D6